MVAINLRRTVCAVALLVCLVAAAGGALPVNETGAGPGLNTTAPTTAATTIATPTPPVVANATPATAGATPMPAPTAAPLTLVLEPALAVYGDQVRCTGSGAGNATVRLLVDGVEAGWAVPGAAGTYAFEYTVDRLPAGVHVVRAQAGLFRRAETSFEVRAVDPVLLLDVAPAEYENQTALLCTGNLTAAGRPVPGAPIHLVFDGQGAADCTTGPEGQFELLAGVQGGGHQVVANVSFDDGRPLNPASSPVVRAELPGGFSPLPVLAGLAVLLVGAGGFLFWRRNRAEAPVKPARPARPAPAPAAAVPPPVVEAPPPAPSPAEDLRALAQRLAGDGGREGIEAVYRALAARLAEESPGARLGTLTPRELAARFEGTPAGVAVARVAACYEAVVYSGRTPTPVDVETVVEGFVAALSETARAGP